MTGQTDERIEQNIAAFVDGQLDGAERFEMTEFLASRPELAAAVMGDIKVREGLKLALAEMSAPASPALNDLARKVNRAMNRSRSFRRYMPFAAAIAIFALGWGGHALTVSLSDPGQGQIFQFVNAALDAQSALDMRWQMVSQPETPVLDPTEVAATLGIQMPKLPADWIVRDVQVVATPDRPGLAIILDTPSMGRVMLFSVARGNAAPLPNTDAFDYGGKAMAVFERGTSAYVLVDNSGVPAELSRGADDLMTRFN